MDGTQKILNIPEKPDLTMWKNAVTEATGIKANDIVFEDGYDSKGSPWYDPYMHLKNKQKSANELTELRIVVDQQRGEILSMIEQGDQNHSLTTNSTYNMNPAERREWKNTISKQKKVRIKKIDQYLASNPYDAEIMLMAVKYTVCNLNESEAALNIVRIPTTIKDDLMMIKRLMAYDRNYNYFEQMAPYNGDNEILVRNVAKKRGTRVALQYASARLQNDKSFANSLVQVEKERLRIIFE